MKRCAFWNVLGWPPHARVREKQNSLGGAARHGTIAQPILTNAGLDGGPRLHPGTPGW